MIISPPLLKSKTEPETDNAWIARVMKEDGGREFPVNAAGSWHGGIHIRHTDDGTGRAESIRAIADGIVVSFRKASGDIKRDSAPLNMNADKAKSKGSDDGYILLKHETEIGSGDSSKVAFYSLYMHLKSLTSKVKGGEKIYRKDALGTSGMVDGVNAFHFQIFCDDDNMAKLVGRTTRELDITRDGRTDAVYGDIHFYLPAGTKFYRNAPVNNTSSTTGLAEVHTSCMPLYVSMTLEKGNCTMVTRQQEPGAEGVFTAVGAPLINADGKDYEYNLYKTAMRLYTQSPSAGFELLRFGRIINTEHETLVPEDAPLWRTVNFPGGKGMVNLAVPEIKKFSDADFPHWTGWQAVDDDQDSNSQCNSARIKKWQEAGVYDALKNRLICHFPLEWEKSTIDTRFSWLRTNADAPMSEEDYTKFKLHAEALCFNTGDLGKKRVWHFNPMEFIEHFRKCGWIDREKIEKIMTFDIRSSVKVNKIKSAAREYYSYLNIIMRKYNISTPNRISHFFGQGAVESGYLISMQEVSQRQIVKDGKKIGGPIIAESTWNETLRLGHWYGALSSEKDNYFSGIKYNSKGNVIAGSYSWKNGNCGDSDAQKFRGRGFKMLTGLDTYSSYWVYRGWISKRDFDMYWWDDPEYKKKNLGKMRKRPPNIDNPHRITGNGYDCIDTGGFFIFCFKAGVLKIIDSDKINHKGDHELVKKVTAAINGGDKGLKQRNISTRKSKEVICDEV